MAVTVREHLEEIERRVLEPGACLAAGSQGRLRPEPESDARTCFMRDRDRIIHSKAFRRLKHKTQVFLSPEGDHYRTRLTHTLEVSQISRTCFTFSCSPWPWARLSKGWLPSLTPWSSSTTMVQI